MWTPPTTARRRRRRRRASQLAGGAAAGAAAGRDACKRPSPSTARCKHGADLHSVRRRARHERRRPGVRRRDGARSTTGGMTSSSDLAVGARCWILDEGGEERLHSWHHRLVDVGSQSRCPTRTRSSMCAAHRRVHRRPDNQSGCKDNTPSVRRRREPHMLHNLRQRYARDAVYTYTAHYFDCETSSSRSSAIYAEERMPEYAGKSPAFWSRTSSRVADRAYRSMKPPSRARRSSSAASPGPGRRRLQRS